MLIPLWELLAFGAIAALLVIGAGSICAHRLLSRRAPEGFTPPVTILKPLRGLDDGLYENLLSFCKQDYPEYEILFGAEDPDDPALEVARRVKREHPQLAISVIGGAAGRGRNPKVRVLRALAPRARHGFLLISDSNVRARPGYLRQTACYLADERVALVTNPISGEAAGAEESLGAALENLHSGAFVNQSACLARSVADRSCVVGKSMLLRASALEAVGGLRSVASVLAEDYLLGRKFEKAGFKVCLSSHAVATINEGWTVDRFLQRHLRWGQMRRRISLGAWLAEPISNPLPWVALSLAARGWSDLRPAEAVAAAGVVVVKCALDGRLLRRLRGRPVDLADLCLIPVKDLCIACLWPVALVKRTVCWRGNELRIGRGSRLFLAGRSWDEELVDQAAWTSPPSTSTSPQS